MNILLGLDGAQFAKLIADNLVSGWKNDSNASFYARSSRHRLIKIHDKIVSLGTLCILLRYHSVCLEKDVAPTSWRSKALK